jgi:hypothetical protein
MTWHGLARKASSRRALDASPASRLTPQPSRMGPRYPFGPQGREPDRRARGAATEHGAALRTDRTAAVIISGLAFLQNPRRGHYELVAESIRPLRFATALAELAQAILIPGINLELSMPTDQLTQHCLPAAAYGQVAALAEFGRRRAERVRPSRRQRVAATSRENGSGGGEPVVYRACFPHDGEHHQAAVFGTLEVEAGELLDPVDAM